MPFSQVWTYEDSRGPVGKLRIMLNGQKIHTEVFCDEKTMQSVELPWGEGDDAPKMFDNASLTALLGIALNLEMQGFFDEDEVISSDINIPSTISPPEREGIRNKDCDTPLCESGGESQTSDRAGPPLTGGERDALRVAINSCWNVGSLSTEALGTTIVVASSISQDGKPVSNSIRLVSSFGGSDEAARQAFEAAKRAIIRCGARGFPLPVEKYSQWRDIEMTFNPEGMQFR
jgi:hypothetical protein